MNKRNIDFTPKKSICPINERANSPPDSIQKTIILDLPENKKDSRYYYVKDIMKVFGVSKSKAYKIIEKIHSENPEICVNENSGQISKTVFSKYLYGRKKENE